MTENLEKNGQFKISTEAIENVLIRESTTDVYVIIKYSLQYIIKM